MTSKVYLEAIGLACPVGLTAQTACAAMRAGISRRKEMPYLDEKGRPLVGSFHGEPASGESVAQRALKLLRIALRDLLRQVRPDSLQQTAILCVLPPQGGQTLAVAMVAQHLSEYCGEPIDPRHVHVLSGGAYAGLQAIASARALVGSRSYEAVLVCGADSLINARVLLRLNDEYRLFTDDNSDGVTPGEAAACVLITGDPYRARATVAGIGLAKEPALLTNDIPLRGDGITAAARDALREATMGMHDLHFRLSDAAAEGYSFKEQVLVLSRLLRRNMESFPLWLTARSLGDVGASAGLCSIIWAVVAFERGYAPGPHAIVYAAQQTGERAALILSAGRG
ncbi:MAG: hypothetical protein AAGF11_10400 [Myxococcota bacterium]